eukprot:CAMPEP_0114241134 /NCGR_PEP_ID=MMETSP0058-20121206/9475_1 /TAXON_ID=36894 /ORGANISM="Pyramimonas parkeae, CCMP726" /LENGTH=313 /DNA_ID=CAMNT_0001353649 /DNA_START=357 /DNA_END=1298 /DNA_ORIENTATION=-
MQDEESRMLGEGALRNLHNMRVADSGHCLDHSVVELGTRQLYEHRMREADGLVLAPCKSPLEMIDDTPVTASHEEMQVKIQAQAQAQAVNKTREGGNWKDLLTKPEWSRDPFKLQAVAASWQQQCNHERPSTTASDELQDLHQAAKQLYLNHLPDYAGASTAITSSQSEWNAAKSARSRDPGPGAAYLVGEGGFNLLRNSNQDTNDNRYDPFRNKPTQSQMQSASIIEQGRAEQGRVEHSVDSDYPAGRTRSPWENWHVYEPAQVPGGFRDPAPVWIAPDTPWHVYVIIVGLVTFISYVITSRAFTMQCQTCI